MISIDELTEKIKTKEDQTNYWREQGIIKMYQL